MLGIQNNGLSNWCNNNTDLLIVTCGGLTLAYVEFLGNYLSIVPDFGFLILLSGVIIVSIGTAALICYRVLLR